MKNKAGIFVFLGIGAAVLIAWLFMTKNKPADSAETKSVQNTSEVLVAGTIEVEAKSLDMARQIPTLFVILREQGSRAPYAVAKIPSQLEGNSLKFELTQSNIMIQGQPTPANPELKVRFDSDGNPMTETPQDVVGTATGFQIGAMDVRLEAAMAQPQGAP